MTWVSQTTNVTYTLNTNLSSWADAQAQCVDMGATLVTYFRDRDQVGRWAAGLPGCQAARPGCRAAGQPMRADARC